MRNKKNRYKKREPLGSKGRNLAKKNDKKPFLKLIKISFFTALGFLCYWFFLSGALNTKNYFYEINDREAVDQVGAEMNIINQSYIHRNFYLVRENFIENKLTHSMPQLEDITVKKDWQSKSLIISATLKRPIFILSCGDDFVLDKDGTILGLKNDEVLPKIIINDLNDFFEVGDRPLGKSTVRFLGDVKNYEYFIGSDIEEIHFLNKQKKDVQILTQKGYSIFLDSERSVKSQLEALSRILNEISKSNKGQVEYIDLRIEDKIYYR
jgi:cell division septal protein FtsQ